MRWARPAQRRQEEGDGLRSGRPKEKDSPGHAPLSPGRPRTRRQAQHGPDVFGLPGVNVSNRNGSAATAHYARSQLHENDFDAKPVETVRELRGTHPAEPMAPIESFSVERRLDPDQLPKAAVGADCGSSRMAVATARMRHKREFVVGRQLFRSRPRAVGRRASVNCRPLQQASAQRLPLRAGIGARAAPAALR